MRAFVELEVSPATYDEIRKKLEEADYGHAFHPKKRDDPAPTIDMHGIGLVRGEDNEPRMVLNL